MYSGHRMVMTKDQERSAVTPDPMTPPTAGSSTTTFERYTDSQTKNTQDDKRKVIGGRASQEKERQDACLKRESRATARREGEDGQEVINESKVTRRE